MNEDNLKFHFEFESSSSVLFFALRTAEYYNCQVDALCIRGGADPLDTIVGIILDFPGISPLGPIRRTAVAARSLRKIMLRKIGSDSHEK